MGPKIYILFVYMARDVMLLMRACIHYEGQLKGWALKVKISTFLSPNGTRVHLLFYSSTPVPVTNTWATSLLGEFWQIRIISWINWPEFGWNNAKAGLLSVGQQFSRLKNITWKYQCSGCGSESGTGFTRFGPPGSWSGSIGQMYGSGSFYHPSIITQKQ
jgi:hypothetical protein